MPTLEYFSDNISEVFAAENLSWFFCPSDFFLCSLENVPSKRQALKKGNPSHSRKGFVLHKGECPPTPPAPHRSTAPSLLIPQKSTHLP